MEKHRGTLAEWLAKLAGHSANQLAVEIEEDDKMLLLGKPQAVVLAGNINSAGTVTGNSATGTVPVTEASAAAINSSLAYMPAGQALAWPPHVAQITSYSALNLYMTPKKKVVTLAAADGGGAVAATDLVVGPAGYYPVIDGLLVYSTVADTFTATIGVTGGALVGPAIHSITTVANVVNTALEKLLLYNLTDASSINVSIAGATVGMVIVIIVNYHYET